MDTTPSLRALDAYLLSRIGKAARTRMAARLAGEGLTLRHHAVLAYLADAGSAAQRDMGRLLGIDPSDMVGAVDDLEQRGCVTRDRDPADRRRSSITLTEDGRAATRRCAEAAEGVAAELLGPLSAEERRLLSPLLDRIFAAL